MRWSFVLGFVAALSCASSEPRDGVAEEEPPDRSPAASKPLAARILGNLDTYVEAEQLTHDGRLIDKEVKMSGVVQAGSIARRTGTQEYRFVVVDGAVAVPVKFSGPMPDTFRDGAEVLVTGVMLSNGTFVGTELLAKCPDGYEPPPN